MNKGVINIKRRLKRLKMQVKENPTYKESVDRTEEKEAIKEILRPNDVAPNDKEYHRYWNDRFCNAPNNNPYEALTESELRQLLKYVESDEEN